MDGRAERNMRREPDNGDMGRPYAVGPMERGRAYGFFDCRAPIRTIERELPAIREAVQTPPEVELSLFEGMDTADPELMSMARAVGGQDMRYALKVTRPGASNRATANEPASVLNQGYLSPLFGRREPFRGAVVFAEDRRYVSRN